ncbi:GTP cyclohydrolase I [Amphibacillus marinus]|uniref:GTP cyclohydrolase FolE2 n=1 Tax=Amphibacillus marinus TaxID=872970 RepID=A0A1H8GYV5_9BACI|nr:GTP cyclohydrolase FolE2 [Amphibacillus marinus]SEN48418.1 GTP cyclohydrolase I [Amphibacillus marinus]
MKQLRQLPSKTERHRIFGSVKPGKKIKPTEKEDMPDLQNKQADFLFELDQVGIANVKHPIIINSLATPTEQTSVASFSLSSSVAQDSKGTNMSRFTEQLQLYFSENKLNTDLTTLKSFTKALAERLESPDALIEIEVPWFFERRGPSSDLAGLNHADLAIRIQYREDRPFEVTVALTGTITTLCPCSKEISEYSAHNQRGTVTMEVELSADFDEDKVDWKLLLLEAAESNASARIHPVLKRPDEKMVTEQAYENPRFVEDIVRLVAADLYEASEVKAFYIACRNQESIHLHDAVASITFDKTTNE